ncbi:MAG: M48 family metallopeptidase [Lachnospiraceae bacterium]|nr:M48 family metallopeptidase [Lachnospiraceae bacterium]
MDYKIIRSGRKTLAIQVNKDGVVVRAPYRVSDAEINRFVSERQSWILKHQEKLALELSDRPTVERLTDQDIQELADEALKVIPERVRHYAPLVGVTYGRITIRNQKSRWGSCSSKGNLNFNCLLMLTPPEVIDSVVVHELCHRKEMNHSRAFYEEVYRVYPEYDKWNRWLKENGSALMRRMTG